MAENNSKKNITKPSTKDLPISAIIFSGKVKFWKLVKSTFIFTAALALVLILFCINGYLTYPQAVYIFSATFFIALMFNYPYIADLQEVTNYVLGLAQDKNPQAPDLSFINNVEELSLAINRMNQSWQEKNDALKVLLLEDEILINSLPNILLMLDADLKFLQTNQAAKNTFGATCSNIIDQITGDENIRFTCKRVLDTGVGSNIKYEMNDPAYFFFNIRIEKFPINSPSKIAIVLILQNLTNEKKNEIMLTDFVANASHEMRTPLASISGFIETLSEVENDPGVQHQFLKIMKDQSDRMTRLISELLTLSVIESAHGKSKFEKLKIENLLYEALDSLRKLSESKKVSIKTDIEQNLPEIFGNRDQVFRIFDNLINNAVKFSNEGEEILVKISKTNNKKHKFKIFTDQQDLICISVTDYGAGIEEQYIPRLTERFFRIDKAGARNYSGTGLGLSIVDQIIENHGGVMNIRSKPGQGSTFTVYLPVA